MTPSQLAFFAVLSGVLAFSAAWSGVKKRSPQTLLGMTIALGQIPAASLWITYFSGYRNLIGLAAPVMVGAAGLLFATVGGFVAVFLGPKALEFTTIAVGGLILPIWIVFFGGFFLLPIFLAVIALISIVHIIVTRKT